MKHPGDSFSIPLPRFAEGGIPPGRLIPLGCSEAAFSSLYVNEQVKITDHLSSGNTPPALFAESLGKLIHPFRGWLTEGNTASQYPFAAMSKMFHLSIVAVETGALGRPVQKIFSHWNISFVRSVT